MYSHGLRSCRGMAAGGVKGAAKASGAKFMERRLPERTPLTLKAIMELQRRSHYSQGNYQTEVGFSRAKACTSRVDTTHKASGRRASDNTLLCTEGFDGVHN